MVPACEVAVPVEIFLIPALRAFSILRSWAKTGSTNWWPEGRLRKTQKGVTLAPRSPPVSDAIALSLSLPRSGLASCCQIMLVKRLPDQGLDYRLAANVQFLCRVIQFVQHRRRKVYIHPLNWTHYLPRVCEKTRDVLSPIGEAGNVLG